MFPRLSIATSSASSSWLLPSLNAHNRLLFWSYLATKPPPFAPVKSPPKNELMAELKTPTATTDPLVVSNATACVYSKALLFTYFPHSHGGCATVAIGNKRADHKRKEGR